jgi:copper chaperone CopZ
MKTTKKLLLALAIMFGVAATSSAQTLSEADVTFKVNIHCHSCKAKLEKNIPFEKGVKDLVVSLPERTVYVKYNPAKTDVEKLQKAIEKLGYNAKMIEKKAEEKK